MAALKKKSKAAPKTKSKRIKISPTKKPAGKLKPKRLLPSKSKKKTAKSKVAVKKPVNKNPKSVGKSKVKKNIKILIKKKAHPAKRAVKKNIHKAVSSKKKQATTFRKVVKTIEKETKSIMKPFGDLAVAVINTVDDALIGIHHPEKEKEDDKENEQ